ncbi:MAG: hypothetical protein KAH30_03125 [Caldisericia bacterium]|jgi:hypothetical protein|nr:hypothetical protein [Caldisericia bacterium]
MTTLAITFSIIGGLIWGGIAGFLQFHWLYKSSKKAITKGVKPISNPLRMFLFAGALFAPVIFGIYALLATFGGFALGFAVWWIWFKIHLSSGGKNA